MRRHHHRPLEIDGLLTDDDLVEIDFEVADHPPETRKAGEVGRVLALLDSLDSEERGGAMSEGRRKK